MATTKEIKNWEWIKSVEVQYMGFLTQYLGTATDSNIELMKQLRLDEAIAYTKRKGITGYLRSSKNHSPSNSKSITRILYNRYYYLLLIRHNNVSYQISDGRMYRP